jgi:hypothetical protein
MTAKRYAIPTIFLFAFIAISLLSALDARDGLVRVTIDEMNGHVILYRLVNLAGLNKYEPLVYDADSTTSFLTVSVNGILYKMGDSREYRFSTKRIDSGAEVTFSTFGNSITQRVVFVMSTDSRIMNGFRIEYIIKNNSPSDIKVKLRQIWDTFLAENSGIHFATNVRARTTEEMQITRSSPEMYIATPGEAASLALLIANIERPDNIIFADWKRISDFPFDYDNRVAAQKPADTRIHDIGKQASRPRHRSDTKAIERYRQSFGNISAVSDNDVQKLLKRLGALENPAPSTDSPSK